MVNHNNSCWLNIRKSEEKKLSKCIEHVCIKANTIPFGEHKKFKKKKTHHQLSISGHKLSLVFKCCSELYRSYVVPFISLYIAIVFLYKTTYTLGSVSLTQNIYTKVEGNQNC